MAVLARDGHSASAPDLRAGLEAGAGAYEAIGYQLSAIVTERTVIVAHSGAGGLIPSIRGSSSPKPRIVFLDALLPHPDRSWLQTLPPAAAEQLVSLALDGRAAAWPTWLSAGYLSHILPRLETREALVAEAPRVPLSFLRARAPPSHDWAKRLDSAYLQLSPAYKAEADAAERLGWPVVSYPGHHLSMITDPERVARSLLSLTIESA
ncbi:MAG TPA: alpha/beta fold hydrolase [Caulobacteraceae bacterium]